MRIQSLTREEFIEWLAQRSDSGRYFDRRSIVSSANPTPVIGSSYPGQGSQPISLVWIDELSQDPVIAVETDGMRDFFAFVSTYVGTYSPFTAFFRVIPKQLLDALPLRPRAPEQATLAAFLGAIICDAAVQTGSPPPKVSSISVQACLATPSASMVSALLLGYDLDMALAAIHRWYAVRADLNPVLPRINSDQVMTFWSTAAGVLMPNLTSDRGDVRIHRIVSNLIHGSGISLSDLSQLSDVGPDVYQYFQNSNATREDRVRALESFVSNAKPRGAEPNFDMLLGYFIAQVAEGSLNYLSLAGKASERFPLSMLWYGFFAGLSPYSEVFTAGECLGRRIARRLTAEKSALGSIHADLSYEELALYQQENRLGRLRTDQASTIEVELFPGVTGKYRLLRDQRRDEESAQLTFAWEAVRRISNELQSILRDTEQKPGQQRLLFEERLKMENQQRPPKQSGRKKPYR